MNKSVVVAVSACAAFAAACVWFLWSVSGVTPPASSPYEPASLAAFAQCVADRGATMYGATWCSHCQKQKAEFGAAFPKVKYVECAAGPLPQDGQTPACAAARIESYPTWTFRDGTRSVGEMAFSALALKTSCPAPTLMGSGASVNLTGSAAQR